MIATTTKLLRGVFLLWNMHRIHYRKPNSVYAIRTSDGGNGNHSVSLLIILIKIKVDQMLPSSYISSLLVYIL